MGVCSHDFDETHFANGWREVEKFFRRHGHEPDLRGKRVLDVGCGRGNLVIHAARRGAIVVVGVDPDPDRIRFAESKLAKEDQPTRAAASFQAGNVSDLPADEQYDVIFSKDAFEHIMDVPGVIAEMRRRLAPGGRALIGFGPLWRSPYGDHHWAEADVPWGHLFLPEKFLVRRIEKRTGNKIHSFAELELNRWGLHQFLEAFSNGLVVESLRLNQGDHAIYHLTRPLVRIPLLGELVTFNVYCVLRRN